MRRLLLGLVALSLTALPARAEVRYGSFESRSVGKTVAYAVDLPPSYASSSQVYPALYFLHGLFENHTFWERRSLSGVLQEVRSRGELPEFLVVSVDGGNSFFVNSPLGNYEDLVTQELIAHVESTYRAIPARHGRALAGISMGGYAALRIALKSPEVFQAVATHSAMLLTRIPTAEDGARRGQMLAFQRVFGEPIDPGAWTANDPLAWAERAGQRTPALYFDCGSEDRYGLFEGNRALHEKLELRKVRHEFALHPGDHGYEYVKTVLDRSLRFIGNALRAAAPAAPRR